MSNAPVLTLEVRKRIVLGVLRFDVWFGAALWVGLTLFATEVSAQAQDPSVDGAARAEFDAGVDAFSEGRYEDAIDFWNRSLSLSGAPELHYNLGTAYDRLQQNEEAIQHFEEYLQATPEASNQREVQARIEALRTAIAPAPEEDPPQSSPQTETPQTISRSVVGPALLLATGGAALVAGGVLLGFAQANASAVEDAPAGSRWDEFQAERDRVPRFSIAGGVALGVGGALALGGLIWLLASSDSERVALSVGPTSLRMWGRF